LPREKEALNLFISRGGKKRKKKAKEQGEELRRGTRCKKNLYQWEGGQKLLGK